MIFKIISKLNKKKYSNEIEIVSVDYFSYPIYITTKKLIIFNQISLHHYNLNPLSFKFLNIPILQKKNLLTTYFLRESNLTRSFLTYIIDFPKGFKKIKTYSKIRFEKSSNKILTILMLDGKREKVLKLITKVFLSFVTIGFYNNSGQTYFINWKNLNLFFKGNFYYINDKKKDYNFQFNLFYLFKYKSLIKKENFFKLFYNFQRINFFKYIFYNFIKKNIPIFSFYVQRVDKNIQKYSRGRSGKYYLMWKYLPMYKRTNIFFHWFKRDIRLQKDTSFKNRISRVLNLFFFLPNLSFIIKLRKFVHKFIFQKYKKNLFKTLYIKN